MKHYNAFQGFVKAMLDFMFEKKSSCYDDYLVFYNFVVFLSDTVQTAYCHHVSYTF